MVLTLILNCGSSSIKFALIDPIKKTNRLTGMIEKIGQLDSSMAFSIHEEKQKKSLGKIDYKQALANILSVVESAKGTDARVLAVGHRVVHGGSLFTKSVIINEKVLQDIEACVPLAPLHNPANILGIKIAQEIFPNVPQVAVFDTAFHQTMPSYAYVYALPYQYYEQYQVRRFGFHGISYRYLTAKAADLLKKPVDQINLILAHLGNGCSICAVQNGKSQDTSMGLTPLEGLVMGTRSGDIDPGIFGYLTEKLNISAEALIEILNKKSGLLGISSESMDMRELLELSEKAHPEAQLAIEIFCYRLAKYIAAMRVPLTRVDALVFSGGIGENAALIRERTVGLIKFLGFEIKNDYNEAHGKKSEHLISKQASIPILVIATNEELIIAEDCLALCGV